MATLTKGKTFTNGETVTPQKLHELVDLGTVTGIVNADISTTAAIADSKLATISTAGKVSNSATTATNANTASTIVARDASGNFSAGTITATLSGNATNVTGTVAVANGGTGATTAAVARTNLGLGNSATLNTGTAAGTVATGNHTHTIANVTGLQTALDGKQASGSYAPATGIAPTAITGTAVITTDSRLSDARTPTSHTHGNLTNAGAIGTTANLPVVTTTSGVLTTVPAGTAGQVLTSNGGTSAPSFQTLSATSTNATNLTGGSAGTVPYQSAAGTTAMLAAGTSGQVLRSNGAAAPSWLTLGNSATLNTGTTAGTVATGNHTHAADAITSGTLSNARTTATDANTANAIVARDASGNFTASDITAQTATLGTINSNALITSLPVFRIFSAYALGSPYGAIDFDRGSAAGNSVPYIQFFQLGALRGFITPSGSGVAYNTSSDYRLKTNLEPLTNAVARLLQIPVHRFNWLAEPNAPKVDGFLAHEAQAVVPESVTGTKDQVDAEGKPIHQGIDQSKLVPLLVAAVQELAARVATLEAAQ